MRRSLLYWQNAPPEQQMEDTCKSNSIDTLATYLTFVILVESSESESSENEDSQPGFTAPQEEVRNDFFSLDLNPDLA